MPSAPDVEGVGCSDTNEGKNFINLEIYSSDVTVGIGLWCFFPGRGVYL